MYQVHRYNQMDANFVKWYMASDVNLARNMGDIGADPQGLMGRRREEGYPPHRGRGLEVG